MDKSTVRVEFSKRLRAALVAAGYEPRPSVLEREFNQRYWGRPVTLHGVRRWLCGESLPAHDKLLTLAEWLRVQPHELRDGYELAKRVMVKRKQWEEAVGYQEREVFEAFLRLPATQRKIIREVILTFSQVYSNTSESAAP